MTEETSPEAEKLKEIFWSSHAKFNSISDEIDRLGKKIEELQDERSKLLDVLIESGLAYQKLTGKTL